MNFQSLPTQILRRLYAKLIYNLRKICATNPISDFDMDFEIFSEYSRISRLLSTILRLAGVPYILRIRYYF
jgi:hypothetical protein